MRLMAQTIQIRNVPKKVHTALVRQAQARGMSLNSYLLQQFERLTQRSRNEEIYARLDKIPGPRPTPEEVVQVIREMRGD